MANRKFYRGTSFCSLEREDVFLKASLLIGAAGAVTTASGLGIKSITKVTGDGKYEIEFEDSYFKYFDLNHSFVSASGSGIAKIEIIGTPATFHSDFKTSKKITIQMFDFAGAAANAASGSLCLLSFEVRNSSEGPID